MRAVGECPSPKALEERLSVPIDERARKWIDDKRAAAGRTPRKYPTLEDAYKRMKEENSYLNDEQARHLTIHGIAQNEDGTYSWKFDNYFRVWPPFDMQQADIELLWGRITCPTLLLYGKDSWASNPAEDGRIRHFKNATVKSYENAGHWLHHDQFERFMQDMQDFL